MGHGRGARGRGGGISIVYAAWRPPRHAFVRSFFLAFLFVSRMIPLAIRFFSLLCCATVSGKDKKLSTDFLLLGR